MYMYLVNKLSLSHTSTGSQPKEGHPAIALLMAHFTFMSFSLVTCLFVSLIIIIIITTIFTVLSS